MQKLQIILIYKICYFCLINSNNSFIPTLSLSKTSYYNTSVEKLPVLLVGMLAVSAHLGNLSTGRNFQIVTARSHFTF